MKPVKMCNPICDEYLKQQVNRTFKILPIYEEKDDKSLLIKYIKSLLFELYGLLETVDELEINSDFLSYCATLEAISKELSSNTDDKEIVKSEVFKSINLINRIRLNLGELE